MNTQKYEIRRNLEMFSQKEFAHKLNELGYTSYYPFKDVGIDILATKKNLTHKYQLKSRNSNKFGEYRYPCKLTDLKKFRHEKNMFWVLCALLPNNKFDFFILPINILFHNWFEKYQKEAKKKFLRIKPLGNHNYEIGPKMIKLDINKYLLK